MTHERQGSSSRNIELVRPGSGAGAAINGTVTDPSGAVIPGARLQVQQGGIGATLLAVTRPDGEFRVESLEPGTYDVEAAAGSASGHVHHRPEPFQSAAGHGRGRRFRCVVSVVRDPVIPLCSAEQAKLTGYSGVLNQPGHGQPRARVGQVVGTGGPRAFQLGARGQFRR
jgi:hypothetical protein